MEGNDETAKMAYNHGRVIRQIEMRVDSINIRLSLVSKLPI